MDKYFKQNVKDHASSEGASGADKINSELKEDSESERSEDCCASSCCASSDQSCAPNTVEVSNEQNQTLHVSVSEFDDMSQYLLKKNPKGMWLRLKYGSLDLLFRLYDEIRWRLDCLRFQTGRYNEFSESYLYVGKGKTWPERVKVKNERQK